MVHQSKISLLANTDNEPWVEKNNDSREMYSTDSQIRF